MDKPAPGIRHWLFQIVPPLLMLLVFATTTSGSSLVFIAGFLVFPVLFSLISVIARLIFFSRKKYYLIRPLLTIAIFALILVTANRAYEIALDQAVDEARLIHQQCNKSSRCPENPAGWIREGSRILKNDLGWWLKYTASYYYKNNSFNIRVYKGPDLGDVIAGGVDIPFEVEPYREQ